MLYTVDRLGKKICPQSYLQKLAEMIDDPIKTCASLPNQSTNMAASSSCKKNKIRSRGKCHKISNTKVPDKVAYANSVAPDQTAPLVVF